MTGSELRKVEGVVFQVSPIRRHTKVDGCLLFVLQF